MKWISLLFIFISFEIFSQACCSGGVPLTTNIGFPAAGKGNLQLSLNQDVNVLKTFKSNSETLDDHSRIRRTHSTLVSVGYSLTSRISTDFTFSYVWQRREIRQPGLPSTIEKTDGFGDVMFLAKYQLTNPSQTGRTWLLGLGGKLPNGKTNVRSPDGIIYILDLQPGSGAIDGIVWSLFSQSLSNRPTGSLNAMGLIRLTGVNDSYLGVQSYEIGNNYRFHIGYSDQFILNKTVFNASLDLRYRHAFRDRIDGRELTNTGGQWLFLSPELRLPLENNLTFNVQVEIPLYASVNGEQLSTTYRVTGGLYFRLGKRNLQQI